MSSHLARRAVRRTVLVPLVFVVACASLCLLPLTLAGALVVDLVRPRRQAVTRALLMVQLDAVVEAVAIAGAGAAWLAWLGRWSAPGYHEANHRLGRWWAGALISGAARIYGLRFQEEGLDAAAVGPYLLLPRHVSIADTLLPLARLARRYGLRPRFVVKRELELDPALDLLGHREPNAFVARHGRDPEGDRRQVAALARDLGRRDFVVIYPEGTRFSPGKRQRLLDRAEAEHDDLERRRVARYRHTLPPHHGGTETLLGAAPGLDVVLLAHVGFDGLLHARDLLSGELVGRTIHLRAWRIPATEVPATPAGRAAWLDDQWEQVDVWVEAHLPELGSAAAAHQQGDQPEQQEPTG